MQNAYTDTGVTAGTTYHYQVSAVNSVGEGSRSNQVSATPTSGSQRVYFQDFDGTSTGWTKSGGSTDLWRLGSGCLGKVSGTKSLQYNRGDSACDYNLGARTTGWAQSPVIDLSGKGSATLRFSHAWETESYAGGAYDIMRIQVSSNSGSTWTTLQQWDSRNANQLSFQQVAYDVSPYISSGFRVRVFFDSVDGTSNVFRGWHVDDVEVVAG